MKRGYRKGLSPIIATVLLVFMVLIMAAVIFLWARGFFSEQLEKNGLSIEEQCSNVEFRVDRGYLSHDEVELDILNSGSVSLYAIAIKEVRRGDEATNTYYLNLGPGQSTSIFFEFHDKRTPESIMIYPVLLGSVVNKDNNKEFTCVQNPTRMNL